ncbi:MAG: septum site-determining protein MinC [Synechococcaceae bacterium WB9_2_112]|nr:septum site-determining protein MinC [Synechococcaceae bacterium WB9_2_112]
MATAELDLRDGPHQPRPLVQVRALLSNARLQQTLPEAASLTLRCGSWTIGVQELSAIRDLLAQHGLPLQRLLSHQPSTCVAAASLAIAWERPGDDPDQGSAAAGECEPRPLRIHQGTLRSGDHLETDGSLLVLGDVNPGARVEAGGHVLVWGTLRGVAHAGCHGDRAARITALQLRPVQLRIAEAVARGPEDLPVAGVAEQAQLVDGVIAINPATAQWPLA